MRKDLWLKQAVRFFIVSGGGWIIDFSCYIYLSQYLNISVGVANCISAVPAITFVFLISTKKIFIKNSQALSLKKKYMLYICYQAIILILISGVGQILFNLYASSQFSDVAFISRYIRIIIKILITPFTMLCNFIVMKSLIEKL